MKKVHKSSSEKTFLNEVALKEDELDFLRSVFESNKEQTK
jgi:hypothetical protein